MGTNWQERRGVAYAAVGLLSLLLIVPGLNGPPLLHDSHPLNLVWADQFTAQLRQGVLYPRWLPHSHDGLGSPTFYFYPPLSFHLAGLFGLAGLSTYGSLMAAFASLFALSGVGMWHWLKSRAPHPLLGALLFMVLPYHLMDFALRGALAESLGFALLPWLALALRRVAERRGSALLALTYGALIMSHLPLALLASLFLVAPYALWHRGRLWHFAPPLGLGIGLSAIYLLPALGLEPYRDAAQLYTGPNLTAETWTLWHADWSEGSRQIFFTLGACLAAPLLALAAGRRDRWAIGGAGIALLALGLIPFFWTLPILEKVQFPWRSLALAEFALATAVARQQRLPFWSVLTLIPVALFSVMVLLFNKLPAMQPMEVLLATHPEVHEMLPPGVAPAERLGLVPLPSEVHEGRIPPPRVPGMIVRPTFYFPRWSCGEPEPRTKLLMHPPTCTPEPIMTGWEKAGLGLSLLSLLGIGSFAWAARRRVW